MKVLKEKIKKITAGAVLLIALGCMLVSMLGTWVLATDFFTAKETVYNVTMAELAAMIDENNAAYGKDIPVDFTRDPNYWYNFSFIVYKPENATPENPAPLVVCSHGGSSRKELQQPFYLELVRRGFVVISIAFKGYASQSFFWYFYLLILKVSPIAPSLYSSYFCWRKLNEKILGYETEEYTLRCLLLVCSNSLLDGR